MSLPIEHPDIVELTRLAKNLNGAVRRDAVGFGSATAGSLAALDAARTAFERKLRDTNPARIAELLLQLDDSLLTEKVR